MLRGIRWAGSVSCSLTGWAGERSGRTEAALPTRRLAGHPPSPPPLSLCQSLLSEGVFPAPSRTGQGLAAEHFLLPLHGHLPPTAPATPSQSPLPVPRLTSSTWGPRPSRIRCAASAFFCRVMEKRRN